MDNSNKSFLTKFFAHLNQIVIKFQAPKYTGCISWNQRYLTRTSRYDL